MVFIFFVFGNNLFSGSATKYCRIIITRIDRIKIRLINNSTGDLNAPNAKVEEKQAGSVNSVEMKFAGNLKIKSTALNKINVMLK